MRRPFSMSCAEVAEVSASAAALICNAPAASKIARCMRIAGISLLLPPTPIAYLSFDSLHIIPDGLYSSCPLEPPINDGYCCTIARGPGTSRHRPANAGRSFRCVIADDPADGSKPWKRAWGGRYADQGGRGTERSGHRIAW